MATALRFSLFSGLRFSPFSELELGLLQVKVNGGSFFLSWRLTELITPLLSALKMNFLF
jgi:hypothetical protein